MATLTPQQRIALAYQAEQKYGLPKGMLVAQLKTESGNGKNNYNTTTGATGPMQFMPATAAAYGVNPNDDASAIDGAGRFMAENLKKANGNPAHALELYYAGSEKGIGPKSKAYPGTVANNWNDDDAFDAASNFSAPTTPSQADDDRTFEKSANLTPPPSSSGANGDPTSSHVPSPQVTALEKGMEQIAETTHDPYQVRRFVRDSGYDPSTMGNLDDNAAAGHINFDPSFEQNLRPIEHNTLNDLEAGVERGASDVGGTIRGFASYMDNQFPALAAIDRAGGSVFPALKPENLAADAQSSVLSRRAYDQNYDSLASGAGRLGAQIALTVPVVGAAASGISAAAPEALGDFVLGRAGGNLLTRAGSLATAGAGYGAATNALTSAASDEPLGQRISEGAKVGAALGPVAGAVGSAVGAVANRVAPGVDAATAKLAQLAQDKYGITLGPDQITNSPLVRKVSAMMNLNPINNNLERDAGQRSQFTRAVGQTFGADSDRLTPEVMTAAKQNIGSTMNAIAARNPVHVDDTLLGDLADIEHTYSSSVTDQEMAPIRRNLDNILGAAKNGDTITGDTYQRLTAKGSPLDIATSSSNPSIRSAAIQIRGALDDALERSAEASGNGADIQALRAARLAYKNMKTVEPLVSKDSENQITPALLNNRVSVNFKNRAYQGAGDLDELAQIGQRFLNPPHTSGTPEGIRAQRLLEGAGTGTALSLAAGGHLIGYPALGDAAGLALFAGRRVAGGASNAIIKRVIQSGAYKNRLLNGALDADVPRPVNGLPFIAGNRILQTIAYPPALPPQGQPQ